MSESTFFVKGQGVVLFKNKEKSIHLVFCDKHKENMLQLVIDDRVTMYNDSIRYIDPSNVSGVVHLHGAYYWVSMNAQTQQIYVGVGEPRLETVIYQYKLTGQKGFLESLLCIEYDYTTTILKILKDPITRNIPLVIKNTDDITMTDIASSSFMPKANLSLISQKLYDCISGKKFVLDDADFPDFTKAIEHSIATPGLWCNTKLESKSREFNPDKPNIKETYLRITLGENNGESPGIPYVMEIWPSNHFSPIHSHANASAIIRVLHGSIHVRLYPFLCAEKDGVEPFGTADFNKNEITWISPTLNQTHQLINKNGKQTCITIQCYMYENENNKHYDYFDFLDDEGNKQKYEPDSDMDFISFKELMRKEWDEHNKTKKIQSWCNYIFG